MYKPDILEFYHKHEKVSIFDTNCLEYRNQYCTGVPAELSAVSNSWFK